MPPEVECRRASLSDQIKLVELLLLQFAEHQIECPRHALENAIATLLKAQELGFFMVAGRGDDVIGLAAVSYVWTLEHGGKSAWLDELYVLPEHRNQGIGSRLVAEVTAALEAEGSMAIDLEVDEDHTQAEKLYARMGFERLPRRRWVKRLN